MKAGRQRRRGASAPVVGAESGRESYPGPVAGRFPGLPHPARMPRPSATPRASGARPPATGARRLALACVLALLASGAAAQGTPEAARVDLDGDGAIDKLTYILGFDAAQGARADAAAFSFFTYEAFEDGFTAGVGGDSTRLAYLYGYEIGSRLGADTTLALAPEAFLAAFREGLAFATSQLDDDQRQGVMRAVQDTVQLRVLRSRAGAGDADARQRLDALRAGAAQADSLLTAVAAREGVTRTASGLLYTEEAVGAGGLPVRTFGTVEVRYEGRLVDGTVFDASGETPATFALRQVVPGFAEGLRGMRPGGKRTLYIAPELGYGLQGTPGGPIPPASALVFEVELVSYTPPPPADLPARD